MSHYTIRMKIEEQVAMVMFIVGHRICTRAVQELFGYSVGLDEQAPFWNMSGILSQNVRLYAPSV